MLQCLDPSHLWLAESNSLSLYRERRLNRAPETAPPIRLSLSIRHTAVEFHLERNWER